LVFSPAGPGLGAPQGVVFLRFPQGVGLRGVFFSVLLLRWAFLELFACGVGFGCLPAALGFPCTDFLAFP
jgi:hypothetical protein